MTRTREAGFTLLEVLVALTVLGFLMLGLTQGVRFGLLAWDRQSRLIATRGELDAIDRVLRRLIEHMDPGTQRDPPRIIGTARGLEFATDLGPAAGPLGAREADAALLVEGGRLLLRWRPRLHGLRSGPPPPPTETELLRGVEALELAYWGPAGDGPAAWRPEWRERGLPQLVRLRLRFGDGAARQWPDIVVAPRREQPPR